MTHFSFRTWANSAEGEQDLNAADTVFKQTLTKSQQPCQSYIKDDVTYHTTERQCWLIPDEYSCFMAVRLVCADEGIYSSDVKVVGIVLARCTGAHTESGSFDARA